MTHAGRRTDHATRRTINGFSIQAGALSMACCLERAHKYTDAARAGAAARHARRLDQSRYTGPLRGAIDAIRTSF